MAIIDRLASSLGHRDNAPNQKLAAELAQKGEAAQIEELVQLLNHRQKAIRNDCLKVLYEIGYIRPELIAPYTPNFIALLNNRNNRLVWGAMIALACVVPLEAHTIYKSIALIRETIAKGSVITIDNGITVMAELAAADPLYADEVVPFLLNHLAGCRPKEVGQHAERSLVAVNRRNHEAFRRVLTDRLDDLTAPQQRRVKKVITRIGQIPD